MSTEETRKLLVIIGKMLNAIEHLNDRIVAIESELWKESAS